MMVAMKFLPLLFLLSCSILSPQRADLSRPSFNHELATQRSSLIGKWYGKTSVKEGGVREWLRELRVDGTFTIKFKFTDEKKKVTEQVEAGHWGVSPGVYFSLTREVLLGTGYSALDVTNPTLYDDHKILKLGPEYFKYQSNETGTIYETFKVSEEYKL